MIETCIGLILMAISYTVCVAIGNFVNIKLTGEAMNCASLNFLIGLLTILIFIMLLSIAYAIGDMILHPVIQKTFTYPTL